MRLYRTSGGAVVEHDGRCYRLGEKDWDGLIASGDLRKALERAISDVAAGSDDSALSDREILPPIVSQEVWGAGVTYSRSRSARMEESEDAGGGDFYDRVYTAERPEIFFKATPHRVVGHCQSIRVRADSAWTVPEPELTVVLSAQGDIVGYTIADDVSARDIEGENPLYLPQAKTFNGCCALGPGILVTSEALPPETEIVLEILRGGATVFRGATRLSQMKRSPRELVDFLFRDNSFPHGCFLMTGTGIVPPDDVTLQPGDEVHIAIEPIGELVTGVEPRFGG